MGRTLRVLVIAVAAWMLPATAAHAAVYCVHAPVACPGTPVTPDKIQSAIDDAVATPADDEVWIGPGTFNNEPFDLPATTTGGALLLKGSGPDETILTSSGPSSSTRPQVLDAEATVSDLQIQVPGTLTGLIVTRGTAQNVLVTGTGAATGVTLSQGGRLLGSTVALTAPSSVGVLTTPSGDGTVADSTIGACTGVANHSAGTTTVQRTQVAASTGFDADLGAMVVDSSLFQFDPALTCTPNAAVLLRGSAASPRSVRVTNLTAVGGGQAGTAGIRLQRDSGASTMTAEILSSVITGFAATLVRTTATADAAPTATISASAIDEASAAAAEYLAGAEPNLDNPVLGFVDDVGGDYRLTAESELVDRGEATGPAGSSLTDLDGNAREIEGKPLVNGTTPRRDMGAYEYVPGLPTVTASAAPPTAFTDELMTFEAAGDPGDVGEDITYEWAFDDGTTATGDIVDKAFATAGDHLATVTATDASGWTTTADVTVAITQAPPPDPEPEPEPEPDPVVFATTDEPTVVPSETTPTPVVPIFRGPSVGFTRRAAALDDRGHVGIRVLCRATAATCVGRLTLTTVRRVRGRNRTIKLGAALYRIGPGQIATVRLKINRTRLGILRGNGRVTAKVVATVTGGRTARATFAVRQRP